MSYDYKTEKIMPTFPLNLGGKQVSNIVISQKLP